MPKLTTEERFRREFKSLAVESIAWERIWKRAEFGVQFIIDGRHYTDSMEASVDSDDIRWVGEEAFNRLRHEQGSVCGQQGTLTAKPLDMHGDPEMMDFVGRLMTGETENPEKEFEDSWYDIVLTGSAAAYGVGWIDYLPDEGPRGTLVFGPDDPRNFMMDRRVKSTFNPKCRFVARRMRMTIREAKARCTPDGKGWNKKLCDKLVPDSGAAEAMFGQIGTDTEKTTAWVRLSANTPEPFEPDDDKLITVYVVWRRHTDDVEESSDYTEFDPGQRYMRCQSCGYRTENQSDLPANEDGSQQELPDVLENGCPECMQSPDIARHGHMMRVDGQQTAVETIAYPKGYLCVLAPFALPGIEQFLYEGPWPWKLRSYPCTFLPRFRHPFTVTGPSIADLTAWNQTATDMMMRLVLERMVSSEPAPLLPFDRITDSRGQPWEMSTERSNGAYYQGDSLPATAMIGGDPGIPNVWSAVYGAARNALTASQGIADFSISEGQSRDIAAQSVALQVRQEEIPVADYRRRYHRQRGLLTGVLYDFMRAVYSPEQLTAIAGADEADSVQPVAMGDLPNASFRYDTSTDMEPQDEVAMKATALLIQTIEQRPWAVPLIAHANKISPSLVRKAQNDYQQYQQQMAQQQAQAAAQQSATAGMAGDASVAPPGSPAGQEPASAVADRLLQSIGPRQ